MFYWTSEGREYPLDQSFLDKGCWRHVPLKILIWIKILHSKNKLICLHFCIGSLLFILHIDHFFFTIDYVIDIVLSACIMPIGQTPLSTLRKHCHQILTINLILVVAVMLITIEWCPFNTVFNCISWKIIHHRWMILVCIRETGCHNIIWMSLCVLWKKERITWQTMTNLKICLNNRPKKKLICKRK